MVRKVVVLLVCIAMSACAAEEGDPETPPEVSSRYFKNLGYARVTLDAEGRSDFAEGEDFFELKDFAPPAGPLGVATMRDAKSLVFTTADSDWAGGWHPSPRKHFVFVMGGAIEIEVEDGERQRFEQGDIILLEDVSGRGHDTRVVSETAAVFAVVALPE